MRRFYLLCLVATLAGCHGGTSGVVGPFATLGEAQSAVRSIPKQTLTEPLVVKVNGSTLLPQPLVFGASDSGTPQAPIVYMAATGTETISSGERISGWHVVSGQVWAANVGTFSFRQLFINGIRMTPARTPNQGFFNVNGSVNFNNPVNFQFQAGQMSQSWIGAEVVLLQLWGESRLPITAVDPSTQTVTLANSLVPWMIEPGARYWVENSAEFLDQPQEWFLDRNAGVVYYYAAAGEDVSQEDVIAPVSPTLLVLNGVHNVTFTGFTFEYADWQLPPTGYRDVQSAFDVPAAVTASGVSGVTISNSHFAHLGTWAVNVDSGSTNNAISYNEMTDLGAGGIKLGETCTDTINNQNAALAGFSNCPHGMTVTASNQVNGNRVHDIGKVYTAAAGIWLGQTYGDNVCSNEVFNTNSTGISVGWTWDYGWTGAHDNLVAFNKVHDIGRGVLSDLGGVYTLGIQPGTTIRNNLIYNVKAYAYNGLGIYEDEGTSNILVENNIVYLAHSGGFIHNSDGNANRVVNNIFALGDTAQVVDGGVPNFQGAPPSGYNTLLERNILYGNGLLLSPDLPFIYIQFDHNLYFNLGPPQAVDDSYAMFANPLFVAPQAGDFSLQPNSPAFQLGFKQIQLTPSDGPCQ
jgi:hypothetical protein